MNVTDIAELIKNNGDVYRYLADSYSKYYLYQGFVKAKERPRSGKGGRMFTPPETRKFEAKVREWAEAQGEVCVRFPLRVSLTVFEETDNEDYLAYPYRFNTKGDVDNLAKSVLDGINGVLYVDDKQIAKLNIARQYSKNPGFSLTLTRCGLTDNEYANLLKRLRK